MLSAGPCGIISPLDLLPRASMKLGRLWALISACRGGLLAAQERTPYNGSRCDSGFHVSPKFLGPQRSTTERFALIDQQLLDILRCPHDHTPLAVADADLVERVNRLVGAGRVVNLGGQTVARRLDGGLVRLAGDLVYPVIDGIPVLLPDEAIDMSQIGEKH